MPAKKQEAPQLTLAARFLAAHAEMVKLGEQLIDAHVDYLKACHRDLPRQTLEMTIGRNRACTCAIALEVAAKEKAQ
jgi:hypothetical protein